jgi:UDP-N-acetylglucosamine enolpyruvyl transferase
MLRGRVSTAATSGRASLIAAALAAEGESRIPSVEIVERGYARLVEPAVACPVERVGVSRAP